MERVSKIIRELREDNDLTQKEVAAIIGTTQQHYSKYENMECDIPLRVILALSDYYKVSMDYITGRTKCKNSINILNKNYLKGYTNGQLIDRIYALSTENKIKLKEYITFLEIVNIDRLKRKV